LRINADIARNAASMQITNMSIAATGIITLTIINHNLTAAPWEFPDDMDYILIENVVADLATETFLNGTIFQVDSVVDANTITINTFGGLTSGAYVGGGTAARVSNIQMLTKQFNPYVDQDRNVYIQRVDFGVQRTATGQITVDYYPSATTLSMIQEGVDNGSIMGNNILETYAYLPINGVNFYPLEQYQQRLWHPVYFQTTGECIQLGLYFTPLQMVNPNVTLQDFQLEGMILYTSPSAQRLQ
jgi:hypothetical protein